MGVAAAVAVVFAVALLVDPGGLRPFTTARWAGVGVAAAVAAAAVRWRPPRAIALVGLALAAWMALATATAIDPLTAVVGHPRRHLGLAGWAVCALAFLAGTGLAEGRARRALGRAATVAALATGGAAVADLAGWDPFGVAFAGGRAGGLLGQPLYLAVAAVLVGGVAAGVAADRGEDGRWRVAGAAGAAAAAVAVVGAGTRGVWLAAAAAAGITVVLRRRAARRDPRPVSRRRTRPVRAAVLPVALTGVLVVAVAVAVAGPRLAGLGDPDAPGGRARVDEWVVALRAVADDPLTGAGPEGYRLVAPAHVDDGYARRHGRDEVVDRAHSAPLDVAVTAGLPAAALYVALLGLVAVRCGRAIRDGGDVVLVGAAVAVLAWMAQGLVAFPIAEVDPLGWLLAGVVVAATAPATGPGGSAPAVRLVATAGRVVAGTTAGVLAVAGLTAVAADRDLARADAARRRGDVAAAVAAADRATERRPDDLDAWYVAAQVAAAPAGLPAVDNALDRVEAGLERSPDDPALRRLHTDLLTERALRSGLGDDLAAAEAAARGQVAADPAGPAGHRALALVLGAEGHRAEAREAVDRALALDPDDPATRAAAADLGVEVDG